MKMQLAMTFALMTLASMASVANDTLDRLGDGNGCHLLMTEKECVDHIATLERLPAGAEREAYLLAHNQLLREREKACACSRNIDMEIRASEVRYRSGKQALLRL